MSFISGKQLAMMRNTVNTQMLPSSCVISTYTQVSDNAGGWEESANIPVGTVACRVDPLNRRSGQLNIQIGSEKLTEVYQLTVPYDAPIAPHRRITYNSSTYEIVQLDDVHSQNVSRRAVIARVE